MSIGVQAYRRSGVRRAVALSVGLLALTASGLALVARERSESAMQKAAKAFLASLAPDQKAKAAIAFHSEERLNWFYVPRERKGLRLLEMTPAQHALALDLLKVSISDKGFQKVNTIRSLENVLKVMEQGKGPNRDPEGYYFSVFGEPADNDTWGWRFEGHHVSLNFTLVKGHLIVSTPQFLGTNPADVREGPMKGTRVLAAEEDLGRQLVNSLDAEQAKTAIVAQKAPGDILTTNARTAAIQEDTGLPYSKMTKSQQGLLIQLIGEYASVQRPEIAKKRLDAIRATGLAEVKFAWMGSTEKYHGHYYRIQGKSFLIEYDNTQNDANHIHTVWRDFKGDWGLDMLAQHYQEFEHRRTGSATTHVERAGH